MMYKFLLSLLFLVSLTFIATAQTDASVNEGPPSSPEEYEARYQERIKLSEIAGVYIPIDLDDAFQQLERLAPKESIQFYKEQDEDSVVNGLFPKLGRWIIINWGFEGGSRLSHALRQEGITFPEDMARVIMRSWHRHLVGQPIDLEGQVAIIQERIKKEQAERLQNATLLKEERRKVEPGARKD
ncbi:MAG: hypothetical protein H6568_13900 [Lewinellaceae bacterium]|nr:hypothetical protein [Saprospiraceae bacterium]MCB9313848.1 hypothetical protein [Lewinellaceae bacterium]HRW75771.1 hypothetical protein [Saprospiraceae bacterium]